MSSKASEWARLQRGYQADVERIDWRCRWVKRRETIATLMYDDHPPTEETGGGEWLVLGRGERFLRATVACEFARWILDTFGEQA